jgi:hypothetical protein
LEINRDSLLDIYCCGELNLSFSGNFLTEYSAQKNGNILLIDKIGGIGVYPYNGLKEVELTNFSDKEWKVNYKLNAWCRFLVSIFPPRKFNLTQSFEDRIAHHSSQHEPYPTDGMLGEARKYANILVLHSSIWQVKTATGIEPSWNFPGSFDFIPLNEKRLMIVIKKAHSLGMKVIPYMSPLYSAAKGRDFVGKVKNALQKYGFDGVYFDGISMDILYSYQMIRDVRALLKDKILYVHCSTDPLLSRDIYCPFIDTYADYILRGEHAGSFDDKYLRYVISGYNISNSIGHICYYDYPKDFIQKLIDKTLAANARFYLQLPETERESILKECYFPKMGRRG